MGKFFISDTREGDCIITDPPSDCVITSTLDINDVVPNDSGEYVCTAINVAGSDTASVSLTVHGEYSLYLNCACLTDSCQIVTNWSMCTGT